MDSKKSPLALLAQTCSQIGADPQSTATKNCAPAASERKKSVSESQRDKSSPLSVGGSSSDRVQQPSSEPASGSKSSKKGPANDHQSSSSRLTPSDRRSKSISPKNPNRNGPSGGSAPSADASNPSSANGLMAHHSLMMADVSSQQQAAAAALASYKSLLAAGMGSPYSPASYPSAAAAAAPSPYGPPHSAFGLSPGSYPPGFDLGAYASALNAVAKSSMPFMTPMTSTAAMMSGYLASQHPAYSAALAMQSQYGRKPPSLLFTAPATTPTDGGTCRDPYCTGCPSNNSGGAIHMVCTAGCGLGVQCDHLKVPIPAHHLSAAGPAASSPSGQSSPHANKPYICNWIVADNYCGKRFGSSDDLLQHLRTHTNLSSAAAAESAAATSSSAAHPAPPPSAAAFAHPSMMRAYPTPPLSPLSAARYHPYGKPSPSGQQQQQAGPQQGPPAFPPGLFHPHHSAMAGSPYPPSALFHHHPALAPYYSHLSLFAPPRPSAAGSAPLPP